MIHYKKVRLIKYKNKSVYKIISLINKYIIIILTYKYHIISSKLKWLRRISVFQSLFDILIFFF